MAQPGAGGAQPAPPRGPRLRPVSIDDILQTDVVTVEPDTPIATVVAQLAEKDVGSVVVVEDERPIGLITDRAIALALESSPDVTEQAAEEFASGDLVTGTTEMNVFEALRRLEDEEIRRLPIVDDDDDALVGIVTLDDILVLLGAELENAASIIRAQSPRL
jgi:CBS domain-containing protein